jgi:glycosyltransferase involved in cell wall biosynthesis
MKRILILAYYFPPIGMGGTQRIAKFAQYLPQFGWQPTVVTVKQIAYWSTDETLLQNLRHVAIHRTGSLDPQRMLYKIQRGKKSKSRPLSGAATGRLHLVFNKILSFFLLPDSKILWKFHALQKVEDLFKVENFQAVLTTSPPHSVHLLGKAIAERYPIKWVADFRDGWAGGVVVHEPTFFHRFMNRKMQDAVVRRADALIAVSEGIRNTLEQSATANAAKCVLIPNGYDKSDFPARNRKLQNDIIVMCHSGTITKFSNPDLFLQSVKILLDKQPQWREKLKLHFVGFDATGRFRKQIDDNALNGVVEYFGYRSHGVALQFLMNADMLLLIAIGRNGDAFIPGKTLEYLGSQKPIFCITNIRDTQELLERASSLIVSSDSPAEIVAEKLLSMLDGKIGDKAVQPEFLDQFDRRNQTRQLAEILDRLTEMG